MLDTTAASPFHKGERAAQARMGAANVAKWAPKAIRPFMPDQHRAFFETLPFLAVGARDASGQPWATLLAGPPGFAASPDPETLTIDAGPGEGDALAGAFRPGADIGLLGLDFATRRRNRANGSVAAADDTGFRVAVRQSFGNCPQHITVRDWRPTPAATPAPARLDHALDAAAVRLIEAADTFFVASGHRDAGDAPSNGLDVSHRGGAPGFVRVEGPNRIAFVDLAGNKFYNTVGNLMLDPRVGLLFVDFQTGDLLQISGRAVIDWDAAELAQIPRAERAIAVEIETVVALPARLGG